MAWSWWATWQQWGPQGQCGQGGKSRRWARGRGSPPPVMMWSFQLCFWQCHWQCRTCNNGGNNDAIVDLAPHLWVGAELLPLELDEASQRAVVQLRVHQLRDLGNVVRWRRRRMVKSAWWQITSFAQDIISTTWFDLGSERDGPSTLVSTVETTWCLTLS